MTFNIQKFLTENKLTALANRLGEDNEDDILDTNLTASDEDDEDYEDDDSTDDWNKPEPDDSAQFEKEPSAKDLKTGGDEMTGQGGKVGQAKQIINMLTPVKNALVSQWKNKELSTDAYKQAISSYQPKPEEQHILGTKPINIPAAIQKANAIITPAVTKKSLGIDQDEY